MNRTSFLNTQVISQANPALRTCSRPGSSLEWSQCCNGPEALCWVSALPDLLHLTPCSPTCTCAPCLLYGRITLLRNPEDHENTAGTSPSALSLPPTHVGGLVLSVSHVCERQRQAEFSLWPSQCLQAMLQSALAQSRALPAGY